MWLFKVPVAPQDQLGMLSLHVEGLIKAFISPEVMSTGLNPGAEQLMGGFVHQHQAGSALPGTWP